MAVISYPASWVTEMWIAVEPFNEDNKSGSAVETWRGMFRPVFRYGYIGWTMESS